MSDGGDRSRNEVLIEQLQQEPHRFELFQAIRILERETVRRALERGESLPPAVGGLEQGAEREARVRLHSSVALAFPEAAVTSVVRAESTETEGDRETYDLTLGCFGLLGPFGTLPIHYTSLVVERQRRYRDTTLRDFLDLFVRRLAALKYRAWCKYRQAVQHEEVCLAHRGTAWDVASEPRDAVTSTVASLVGLGATHLTRRMAADDNVVHGYAGQFARLPRTAACLEAMLGRLVSIGVSVRQFIGRWLELERNDQTALGWPTRPDGQHACLGRGAILGRRVWDVESTFEVCLGPLSNDVFRSHLPGGHRLQALGDLLRMYAGPQFEIRVRLMVAADHVPGCRLGGEAIEETGKPTGSRLGWTSWLVEPVGSPVDRDDPVFRVAT
jgi:type VI secretion system protein ImpH